MGPGKITRKYFEPRNAHEKKFQVHGIPTRKNFGLTKYPRKNVLDQRNTHNEKIRTHEIPTIKKFWTHDMPKRKKDGLTKYPREKF